jgi:hypothetical protein
MSTLFFDHLISFEKIEKIISSSTSEVEEREELWRTMDDVISHSIVITILDKLPREHHEEFLNRFYEKPYDRELIIFLNERIETPFEELLNSKIEEIISELTEDLEGEKSNG